MLSIKIDDALAGEDPRTKIFLYTASEDLDPFSDEAIRAANPAFDTFMSQDEVRRTAAEAKRMPSQESSYRNLILNQRIARESPFVSATVWKENGMPPREDDFRGDVVMALDLSTRLDLTALTYTGLGADGCRSLRSLFFLPKEGIRDRSKQDRVPYDVWAKQGHLKLCPGKSVSYKMLAQTVIDICKLYNVVSIKFDRWKINELKIELENLGYDDLPLEEHGQGYKDMSPALEFFEGELVNSRIRHGNNPILTWNAANSVVDEDPAGNRKLNKKKATGRIDGMVSAAMCIGGSAVLELEEEPGIMMI